MGQWNVYYFVFVVQEKVVWFDVYIGNLDWYVCCGGKLVVNDVIWCMFDLLGLEVDVEQEVGVLCMIVQYVVENVFFL